MTSQKVLRLGMLFLLAAAMAFSIALTEGAEMAKADDGCCDYESCYVLCGGSGWSQGSWDGQKGCVQIGTICDALCDCQ